MLDGVHFLSRHPLVAWSSGDSATCAHASVRAAVVPLPHQHRLHRGRRVWRPRARPSATNGPCVRVHSTPTELRSLVVAPPALVEVTQCSTTMQYKHAEGAAVISPRMVPSTSGGAGAGVGSGAVQVQKTSDWCALPSMSGTLCCTHPRTHPRTYSHARRAVHLSKLSLGRSTSPSSTSCTGLPSSRLALNVQQPCPGHYSVHTELLAGGTPDSLLFGCGRLQRPTAKLLALAVAVVFAAGAVRLGTDTVCCGTSIRGAGAHASLCLWLHGKKCGPGPWRTMRARVACRVHGRRPCAKVPARHGCQHQHDCREARHG